MNKEYLYLIDFKCIDDRVTWFSKEYAIVSNAKEAYENFIKKWDTEYKSGKVDIPSDKLDEISIKKWCEAVTA